MTEKDAEILLLAERKRRLRETVLMECKIYVGEWPGPRKLETSSHQYSGADTGTRVSVSNFDGVPGYPVRSTVGVRSGAGYRMW